MTEMNRGGCGVDFELLLDKVYLNSGRDFRRYRQETIVRRLHRRLDATGCGSCREYMRFLDDCPQEYERLADCLTIAQSGFFRTKHAFERVARIALRELVAYKMERGQRTLRLWSAACAGGQEPYSIAILLEEALGPELQGFDVAVYATDVNRYALAKAMHGTYSVEEVEKLPPRIVESYFRAGLDDYEVAPAVRQMVSFSYFDLVANRHAPFSNLDCVFCCNVLIYLETQLQTALLHMLYDTLSDPGYLVLGQVETVDSSLSRRFECVDTTAKIFKKAGRMVRNAP